MLHPLPKNVFASRLVSTLAITTHPPRCCVDHARLVADKLANGKEPKEARQGCAIAIAIKDYGAQTPLTSLSLDSGLRQRYSHPRFGVARCATTFSFVSEKKGSHESKN